MFNIKIIFVDIATDGHHLTYVKSLVDNCGENEPVMIMPEKVDGMACRQYEYKTRGFQKNIFFFLRWIYEIYSIVKSENPDIVHFLYGDMFYRFFGLGLCKFRKYKTVATFHLLREGTVYNLSMKMISSKVDSCVVHSEYIKNSLVEAGIDNVVHIEYPVFNSVRLEKKKAREYFGLPEEAVVLGCIGGTRYDKGLDVLLEALNFVEEPYYLLIAGQEEYFKEDFIKEKSKGYKEQVKYVLKFLTDEELTNAMNAIDVVVLPYRRWFNGASGPLGEGVSLGKCVIGPNHGNLCDTITKNHLGFTFETENTEMLAKTIKNYLNGEFLQDDIYKKYQASLRVSDFILNYKSLYESIN